MSFKFEQLDVWNMSLDYSNTIYELAEKLPESERFNLKSKITRAATSISLNTAEGSTDQTDLEQSRFLGMTIRSLIVRRKYINDKALIDNLDLQAQRLAKRLHSFRRSLARAGN
jgi:four helix bundle protein